MRNPGYIDDNRSLVSDAGNLAALLLRFREYHNTAYQRIIKTIRLIAPFFDDFVLEPRANNVILNWQGKDSDQVFGPHQFSDGTLRAICLTTLLLQRLNSEELEAWLEEYSLGEIWEKNIIGGGPH